MRRTSRAPCARTRSSSSTSGRPGAARAGSSRPIYEAAAEANPDLVFGSVNTETEQALSSAAQVSSIPTLMAFKSGRLVFAQPGALPATALDQVVAAVRELDVDSLEPIED